MGSGLGRSCSQCVRGNWGVGSGSGIASGRAACGGVRGEDMRCRVGPHALVCRGEGVAAGRPQAVLQLGCFLALGGDVGLCSELLSAPRAPMQQWCGPPCGWSRQGCSQQIGWLLDALWFSVDLLQLHICSSGGLGFNIVNSLQDAASARQQSSFGLYLCSATVCRMLCCTACAQAPHQAGKKIHVQTTKSYITPHMCAPMGGSLSTPSMRPEIPSH